MISERINENANYVNYRAGPIRISVSGCANKIRLSCKKDIWIDLLKDCLEISIKAWELNKKDITWVNDKEIEIIYNFESLKLYIDYAIIFK